MKILQMIASAAIFSQTTAVSVGTTREPSKRIYKEYDRLKAAIEAKITPEDITDETMKFKWAYEFELCYTLKPFKNLPDNVDFDGYVLTSEHEYKECIERLDKVNNLLTPHTQ